MLNSRIQEQIAPFLQQTIQGSRIHWPYEENMPNEELYGDDQRRDQRKSLQVSTDIASNC